MIQDAVEFLRENELITRNIAKSSGFNMFGERDYSNHDEIIKQILLIQTEISEAVDEIKAGDSEKFYEELADIIIRGLSFVGDQPKYSYIMDIESDILYLPLDANIKPDLIGQESFWLKALFEASKLLLFPFYVKEEPDILQVFRAVYQCQNRIIKLCNNFNIDLELEVKLKHAKNQKRIHKHGKRF